MATRSPFGAWAPADFADLGPRDAVDQVLHRLVRAGTIRRITRGLYDKPSLNALTGKSTHPDPRAVIDALARRDSARMIVDGITAANDIWPEVWGLSDGVPARIIVHTDARLKSLALGNLVIRFKKTAPNKLFWAGRPAMRVVQAVNYIILMIVIAIVVGMITRLEIQAFQAVTAAVNSPATPGDTTLDAMIDACIFGIFIYIIGTLFFF